MIVFTLIFLFTIVLLLLGVNWIMEYKYIHTLRDFNYAKGIYITANLMRLLFISHTKIADVMSSLLSGLTYMSISLFGQPIMIIADPDLSQAVINKIHKKGILYSTVDPLIKDGLITIDNLDLWKLHRRFLTPAFNMTVMGKKYVDILNSTLKEFLQELHEVADRKEEITSWAYMYKWQMRFVFGTLIRGDIDPGQLEYLQYWSNRIHNNAFKRFFMPLRWPVVINQMYEYILGYRAVYKYIHSIASNALSENRKIKDSDITKSTTDPLIIDLLTSDEAKLIYSHENLLKEIITFYEAGVATTGTAFYYTLLMLAIHTEAQEKVYREILEVLGDDEFINNEEQLNKLVFLHQCINETMRRFTVVPGATRQTYEDTKLKDGRIIPKNTIIILSFHHMHNNENLYPNSRKWDPNRFDESEVKKRHPASFLPFGTGPRMCIGYKLVYMNLKIQLATILKQFHVTTNLTYSEIENSVYISIVLKSTCRNSLIFRRRNQ